MTDDDTTPTDEEWEDIAREVEEDSRQRYRDYTTGSVGEASESPDETKPT